MDIQKEKEPVATVERVSVPEEVAQVEAPRKIEENLEVESWIRKIERKFARVPNQTSDVTDDTVVVQQPQTQQPPITLPVNQQQMQAGKKAKVDTGIAWLVAWAVRQIRLLTKLGRDVRLQDMPEIPPEDQNTKVPK